MPFSILIWGSLLRVECYSLFSFMLLQYPTIIWNLLYIKQNEKKRIYWSYRLIATRRWLLFFRTGQLESKLWYVWITFLEWNYQMSTSRCSFPRTFQPDHWIWVRIKQMTSLKILWRMTRMKIPCCFIINKVFLNLMRISNNFKCVGNGKLGLKCIIFFCDNEKRICSSSQTTHNIKVVFFFLMLS